MAILLSRMDGFPTLSVIFLIFFVSWNVGATSFDHAYTFSESVGDPQVSPLVKVVSIDASSSPSYRARRQSGPGSPDASSAPNASSTPDSSTNDAGNETTPDSSAASSTPGTQTDETTTPATTEPTTTPGPNPFDEADLYHDFHTYYTSDVTSEELDQTWVELENATRHTTLSTSHRVAAMIDLKFPFYFYGHKVEKITVATGGFIYMNEFLHMWLTATQYIAPLMANFDPSSDDNSHIYYQSLDDKFTVEWKDVILKDQSSAGPFHFQVVLHKNSSIQFLYKKLPLAMKQISTKQHPVKVGLSDAWYNDTLIVGSNILRRTIIEYHRVSLNFTLIRPGSVVWIHTLPTCNRLETCDACTAHTNVSFDCKWCNKIGRCSDGLDWYRQHWNRHKCGDNHHTDPKVCDSLPPPSHPIDDPNKFPVVDDCQGGDCSSKKDFPTAAVVIIILFVLALVGAAGGWVYYAYTHPTSRSGMWLMEHRPSQIKARIKFWKSNNASGAKYQAETEA